MPTLDTTDVIAVKFQADTVQTIDGKTFAFRSGEISCIDRLVDSIVLDVATDVGCMLDRNHSVMQGFQLDELRTPV